MAAIKLRQKKLQRSGFCLPWFISLTASLPLANRLREGGPGRHLQSFWRIGRSYLAILLLSLLLFSVTAQAQSWEEVYDDKYYLNSDSSFVDFETGFVFFEAAAWDSAEDDYNYSFMAVDCTRWESFAVAALLNGSYHYMENWQTDPRLAAGPLGNTSYMSMTASRVCGIRDSLPKDYPRNRF